MLIHSCSQFRAGVSNSNELGFHLKVGTSAYDTLTHVQLMISSNCDVRHNNEWLGASLPAFAQFRLPYILYISIAA